MTTIPANRDWLALTVEEALEPDLPICDPHHHFWVRRDGVVQQRYLLDDLNEDIAGGHAIRSTVFIECGAEFRTTGPEPYRCLGETEFVTGLAAGAAPPSRIAAGIVGTADLTMGDAVADILDAQIAVAEGRFRGVRLGAFWHPSPEVPNHRTNPPQGLLLRDDFRAGFKHLAPRALTFEAWCVHTQIPEVTDLARAAPDTTIVLDHYGGPVGIGPYAGKPEETFAEWRAAIDELATCPNVVVKLGGLNMAVNGFGWHLRARPPGSAELAAKARDYFAHTVDRFGVGRCMFESNFPIDKLSCSYTVLWNAFKRLTECFTATERAALFHDTAARVYRL